MLQTLEETWKDEKVDLANLYLLIIALNTQPRFTVDSTCYLAGDHNYQLSFTQLHLRFQKGSN